MDEADQLSDRISIIDHGRIITSGTSYGLKNTLGQDLIYLETSDNEAAIRILQGLPNVRNIKSKTKGFVLMVKVGMREGYHAHSAPCRVIVNVNVYGMV
jgi:ABC-2 type transport system ATP-binding protein